MKNSQLIGKRITRVGGEKHGYVLSVLKVGTRIVALRCSDENEREFFVDFNGVQVKRDAVLYQNSIVRGKEFTTIGVGKKCYDKNGNFFGAIKDAVLHGDVITHVIIGKKTVEFKNFCEGDVIIFKNMPESLKDIKPNEKEVARGICERTKQKIARPNGAGEYVKSVLLSL